MLLVVACIRVASRYVIEIVNVSLDCTNKKFKGLCGSFGNNPMLWLKNVRRVFAHFVQK